MNIKNYCCDGKKSFSPEHFDPADTAEFASKSAAATRLAANIERMAILQDRLYAENKEAVLIIFQAMDAAVLDTKIAPLLLL